MARLARIYSFLGFFDQGLPLALQSLQIREKVLGPEHRQTAQSLLVLGMLYAQMGVYDKALQMTRRALQISETAAGPEDPVTAAASHNLAMLYSEMGSYDQALPWPTAPCRSGKRIGTGKLPDRPKPQQPGICLSGQERL